ncbi:MAG: hypothetical protein AAGF22_07120 [Pseudomonadota bacterium]
MKETPATVFSGILFGFVVAVLVTALCAAAGYSFLLCVFAYILGGAVATTAYLIVAAYGRFPAPRVFRNSANSLIK